MHTYSINIKSTNNPMIMKFETDRFLTRHETFEFANIDEAKNSPLAQQLFHLPFVKTVYIAQNFVAIKKYNVVMWEEVQEETADQIADFLNKGGSVVTESEQPNKKIAVTVYAESTPNPSVMKFVSNKKLVLKTVEFKNIDEAKDAPLVQQLFHFPFVKAVFLDENYVSIHKYDMAKWNEITVELREFIRTFLEEGKTVLKEDAVLPSPEKSEKPKQKPEEKVAQNLDGISQEIVDILDEYIKPAVASDGGNIMFDSYDPESKKVKVILQGACSGCPSSTLTLKNGIETILKDMLNGRVETVEAVS